MQFPAVGARLLGLLSLQNRGNDYGPLSSLRNSIPLALRQTGSPQLALCQLPALCNYPHDQWVSILFRFLKGWALTSLIDGAPWIRISKGSLEIGVRKYYPNTAADQRWYTRGGKAMDPVPLKPALLYLQSHWAFHLSLL